MPRLIALATVFVALAASAPDASAQSVAEANRWLDGLRSDITSDLSSGKPLLVQAHVPLCDNDQLRCGGHGLGDGDSLKRNLYWATSGGFVGWFGRRGSGWKLVHKAAGPDKDILEVRVWRRTFDTAKAFSPARVGKRFDTYVVVFAWRGSAIRKAMDAYTADLYGGDARVIELDDGTELRAGGEAQVVAYVGHNGWMDVSTYDFDKVAATAKRISPHRKGTIAVACITEDYLAAEVAAARRVPLLMTRTLLFAGAHSFEGAVSALAEGRDLAAIRSAAVRSYASGQGKTAGSVGSAFTNPADRRWKRRE